jgi:hypothetical protein
VARGSPATGRDARAAISDDGNVVHVSAASVWGAAIKVKLGRLDREAGDLTHIVVVQHTHGMSKRLQVVLDEAELRRYERAAASLGLTLSAWVRQALRREERATSAGDVDSKLSAVRAASQHAFPAPDIDVMLAEIERGYLPPAR